jgi:uncharacterized protein (DUF362 family)
MTDSRTRLPGSVTRRQFFTLSGLLAGLAALGRRAPVVAAPGETKPKVVHVYSTRATNWNFFTGWWGDHVNQGVVSQMVDRGLMELTRRSSRVAAWSALLPRYIPGQRVAIKVNLNNAHSEDDSDNVVDAAIEAVNAVIAGLKEIGVAESDIWVYDAIRAIPSRFIAGCDYPGVQFSGDWRSNPQGFSATQRVTFQPPPGSPALAALAISKVLVDADYLINMPLMKKHGGAWVTLSFKNHFGSIEDCASLHGYIFPTTDDYTPTYNPMVDIYKNPHFAGKTVVTIADGLYGSKRSQNSIPERWSTFGNNAPRSLFFSHDPVAIDSVMYDFLEAEAGVRDHGDDYLALAAQAGLGVFEHRAAGASSPDEWYDQIDYCYVDADSYVKLWGWSRDGTAHLLWNRPLHPNLSGYRIHYVSDGGGDVDQGSSPIYVSNPAQLTAQLTGLSLCCPYEVWIEPFDGAGGALGESNHLSIVPSGITYGFPLAMGR